MAKLESAIKEKTVSFISPKKTNQTIQNEVWKKVAIQGLFDQHDIPAFRHANQITTNQNIQQINDRFMDLTNVETSIAAE